MMMDIFSSFDPHISWLGSTHPTLFWALMFAPLALISASFWLTPSYSTLALSQLMDIMHTQTSRTFGAALKSFSHIASALFIMIALTNLTGLIPYTFSLSSHLLMTLSLGLPLWLALILSAITHAPSSWAAGLLPGGAPNVLNPFLVLVESVSISVRPITLSFRLAANMTAGHIILGLLGIYASVTVFNPGMTLFLLTALQAFYTIFEIGICLIQAYIFCLLLTLYSDEHPQS